ncbi:hypothetical protein L950_0214805 [Sphingobacterium sp. IITKGP-BTPF85]|nr:hypothetical protein L950_0214805 [Sphingobacterium sp. IITKGP-BTPF85]
MGELDITNCDIKSHSMQVYSEFGVLLLNAPNPAVAANEI